MFTSDGWHYRGDDIYFKVAAGRERGEVRKELILTRCSKHCSDSTFFLSAASGALKSGP